MNKSLLVFTIAVLLVSCKTKSAVETTTSKTDGKVQSELKGNWKITGVTYPGSGYIKVNSFQIADSKCFVGSSWQFVPNNNKGTMSLNHADCPAFTSSIVWSINKEGVFTLKFIESGVKSKSVNQGFMMKIANQTPASFQLIDQINVGGQSKEITYQFEKVN
ncbi:MAG TPA: lipocalin family protein [Prolixibacteraceae bacterium]|nr:lipocalin family protein [Prolixibacteraceae bacterium]